MASTPVAAGPTPGTSQRLLSLDALRGFDMFWIVGAEDIVHALHQVSHSGPVNLLADQLTHKPWAGVAFYDLIFPLFVFIVGVSLVFSLSRAIEQYGKAAAIRRVFWRSVVLFLIGVFYYGGIAKGVDQIRWLGVLQRIALCYLGAGLLFCLVRPRGLVAICAGLLIGYWAVMAVVPIRDINLERSHLQQITERTGNTNIVELFEATTHRVSGVYEEGRNVANHFDFQHLPGRRWDGAYDPEGILSTFPAIATCLLGVFTGLFLKNSKLTDQRKVRWLATAGFAAVVVGFAWGLGFPVVKKLWSSSYVLVAGGYSALFLALFYQVIEVWNFRRWCLPFVWIGVNPITIYLIHNLVDLRALARRFVGGPVEEALGSGGELAVTVVVLAITFLIVRFLYRRRIFLRV